MPNELQKIGYDISRAAAEAGEIREPVLNTGGGTYSKIEQIIKDPDDSTYWHWPSVERLLTGSGSATPTDSESITAGIELLGVDDNNFQKITGDCTLRTTIKSIDTALNSIAAITDVILKDGTIDMQGDWTAGSETYIGSEMLDDVNFADGGKWTETGDFSVSSGMVYTNSTGAGTFKQPYSDMVTTLAADTWYVCEMLMDQAGGDPSNGTIQLSIDGNIVAKENLRGKSSIYKFYFKTRSDEGATSDLLISVDSTSSFTIDSISLKPLNAGIDFDGYMRCTNGIEFGNRNFGDEAELRGDVLQMKVIKTQDNLSGDYASVNLQLELLQSENSFSIINRTGTQVFEAASDGDNISMNGVNKNGDFKLNAARVLINGVGNPLAQLANTDAGSTVADPVYGIYWNITGSGTAGKHCAELANWNSNSHGLRTLINTSSDSYNILDCLQSTNVRFKVTGAGGIFCPAMKSGTTQVGAGAAAGELWADTDDGYTVKLGT